MSDDEPRISQRFTLDEFDDLLSDLEGNIKDIDESQESDDFDNDGLDDLDALVEDLAVDDTPDEPAQSDSYDDLDDVLKNLEDVSQHHSSSSSSSSDDEVDFDDKRDLVTPSPPPTSVMRFSNASKSSSSSDESPFEMPEPPRMSPPRSSSPPPRPVSPSPAQELAPAPQRARVVEPTYSQPVSPRPRHVPSPGVVHYRLRGPREVNVGAGATYTIESENEQKSPVNVEEHRIRGDASGSEHLNALVKSAGHGKTSVTFYPTRGGSLRITIYVDDKSMFNNVLEVRDGSGRGGSRSTEEYTFECQGSGVRGGKIGQQASFSMDVKNQRGEMARLDTHDIKVRLTGPSTINATISDRGGGRYEVAYIPQVHGQYQMHIEWQGQAVFAQPAIVNISEGADARNCQIVNFPGRAPINQKTSFRIQARGPSGANLNFGGDAFNVSVSGPQSPRGLVMRDMGNGTYDVEFTIPGSGTYSFTVTLNGQHISGSPVDLRA